MASTPERRRWIDRKADEISKDIAFCDSMENVIDLEAKNTTVTAERSRVEIERLLARYGATSFASGWAEGAASIVFEIGGRRVKIDLPMPLGDEPEFVRALDQERARRWRSLVLVIKAKLEAVDSGISTVEREFLADVVVPGGRTLGEWAKIALADVYKTGKQLPPLLGA